MRCATDIYSRSSDLASSKRPECALGWACWKTYVGRPEVDQFRISAMGLLGSGLSEADRDEEALSVKQATLATKRRVGAPEENILIAQSNLASTYSRLGRNEEALRLKRDVYSGLLKLAGEEYETTLLAANNYANSLIALKRYKEAKKVLRKMLPVARRFLGDSNETTLRLRWHYARALSENTLDSLREAVTMLGETVRTARRALGGTHPLTRDIEVELRDTRAALRAREETPSGGA